MCTPPPEWEIPADWQPQPIVFRSASFNKPQYKSTRYNNAYSQHEEWIPEQESQDSDNDGEMLSLTGFSPADSNNHVQIENNPLRNPVSSPLIGEIMCISDLESHHLDTELEHHAQLSALRHRFASIRYILVSDSSGWHALAFSYFEIILHSGSQIHVDEEITRISSLNNLLKTSGQYEIGLIQDMINETLNLLKDLSNFKSQSPKAASDLLLRRFNNPDVCSAIICHFRLIASSWLAKNSTIYEAYIPEGLEINTYRNRWLNAPQQEIDSLGMTLLVDVLLRPLPIGFEVTTISENETATHCTYPKISVGLDDDDSSSKTIHLLHRHNHYDILYADLSTVKHKEPNDASEVLPSATLQASRAEFDAYPFEESYQIPETRFVRDLPTFNAQDINFLPYLANLSLSESVINSIPDISKISRVLNVHTAVSQKTFEAESAALTGLGDITAFAKDREQEEAIFKARRIRLTETEPKSASSPSSSTKESGCFARDSSLPRGDDTEAERSRLKSAEHIPPNIEPPNVLAADPKQVTNSSDEESLGSPESATEYETDLEEEEEEETSGEEATRTFFHHGSILTWSHLREGGSAKFVLGKMKNVLVECLMKEFWDIANQTSASSTRTHGSPPDTSSPSSENNGSLRKQLPSFTPGKRSREDGSGEPPEQDRERGSKKPKSVLTPLESSDEVPHFACPYRKHNPRKYNVNQWGACALTPQKGVARVKSHLYQKHRIHQCQRCKSLFGTQQELSMHILAPEGCNVRVSNPEPVEGITGELREQLQCRKKLYPGQTEAERWQQVYQLLFPDEMVPSPYFEPVRDVEGDDSRVSDSIRLEEHLRREVPRVFRILLDTEVDNELQSIEERLKSRLLGLLEEAQNYALTSYHSPYQVDLETMSNSPFVEPEHSGIEPSSRPVLVNTSEIISEIIHESAPEALDAQSQLEGSGSLMKPKSPHHHSSFDSGCYTDSWITESSQQNMIDVPNDRSLVGEPVRLRGVDGCMQTQKAGTGDSLNEEVWPFHSDIMTMDDPLNFQAFATWSQ